jgi:hypothetical protein
MAPKVSSAHTHDTTGRKSPRPPSRAFHERSAMAQVGLVVPAALVPCVRETVLWQYRAAVEALHLAFGAQGEPGASLAEVRRGRARLARVDALLGQLGWPGEPVPGDVGLAGPADLLRDALHGSLIDAGERLAVACEGSWRGEASAEVVRAAAREVIELDRLLRELGSG